MDLYLPTYIYGPIFFGPVFMDLTGEAHVYEPHSMELLCFTFVFSLLWNNLLRIRQTMILFNFMEQIAFSDTCVTLLLPFWPRLI